MAQQINRMSPEIADSIRKWKDWGVRIGRSCDPVDVESARKFGHDLMVWLGRTPGPVSVQPSPLAAWLAVCAITNGRWDGADDRVFSIDRIAPNEVMEIVWPYLDGGFWANYTAWVNCVEDIGVKGLPTERIELLRRSVMFGPIWPLEKHVVISDRPERIVCQTAGLHCEDGPAVRYRDGFSVWALNGVRVPAEVVTTRGEEMGVEFLRKYICGSGINAEVRREVVRKVGASLVIERLGGKVIDRSPDGVYELVLLDTGDNHLRPYLKMKNPSIGIWHVEGVHPSCDTIEKALVWRNGLDEDKIDDENGAEWIQQGDVLLFPSGAKKFKRRPKNLT